MKKAGLLFIMCIFLSCSASYYYVEGLVAKDRMDYEKAYQEFGKVSLSHPIYSRAQQEMKEIKAKVMALEKARKAAEAALSQNNPIAARIALKKLLSLKPADPWAEEQLKSLTEAPPPKERKLRDIYHLVEKNQFYKAKSALENYLKAEPKNTQALALRKKVDSEISRRESERDYVMMNAEQAEVDGNVLSAYIYYGEVISLLPEDESAKEARDELETKIDPAVDENFSKAQSLLSEGRGEEAIDLLEMNLKARKEHKESRKLIVQILSATALESYRSSNYDMAVDYWKKLLSYDPKNSKAREYMKRAQKLSRKVKEL